MNTLESFFQWLLAASLRASLLAGAVVCLQLALRRWLPARWRYALWLPVVLVLIAPVLPESRLSVQNRFVEKTAPAVVKMEPLPAMGISALEAIPAAAPVVIESRWTPRQRMLAVWLFGTATVFIVGLLGYRRSMRCILRDAVQIDAALADTISSVAEELRLRRAPRILVSKSVGSPAVAGLLRPMLLLPADFPAKFSPAESRLVLMHELTHLKRRDLPMNWLMCGLQTMHWFNPLLWLAFARMRADRETACDAQVLASSGDDCRAEYGNALLKLQTAPRQTGLSLAFVGIFERNAALRVRIQSIAAHRPEHPAWSLVAITIVVVTTMVGGTRAETKAGVEPRVGARTRQILIESKLMETKDIEGVNFRCQFVQYQGSDSTSVHIQDAQQALELLDNLIQAKDATILAAPRVITADKRKATIQVGREIAVAENGTGKPDIKNIGVYFTIVPTVVEGGISLEVTSTETRLVDSLTKREIKGEPPSGAKVVSDEAKFERTLVLKQGETGVLVRRHPGQGVTLPIIVTMITAKVMPEAPTPVDSSRKQKPTRGDLVRPLSDAENPGASTKPDAKAAQPVKKQVKKDIVLPRLDLNDVSVRDAVALVEGESKLADSDKKGVKIVVFPNVDAGVRITLSLKEVRVTEALKFIAGLSNAKLNIQRGVIYLGTQEIAKPVAGKPGFVVSPYNADSEVDARGLPPNTEIECPYTGIPFLIP